MIFFAAAIRDALNVFVKLKLFSFAFTISVKVCSPSFRTMTSMTG